MGIIENYYVKQIEKDPNFLDRVPDRYLSEYLVSVAFGEGYEYKGKWDTESLSKSRYSNFQIFYELLQLGKKKQDEVIKKKIDQSFRFLNNLEVGLLDIVSEENLEYAFSKGFHPSRRELAKKF